MTMGYVRFDEDLIECIKAYYGDQHHAVDAGKRVDMFLAEVGNMFLAVRPHAYLIQLLLQHLIVHNAMEATFTAGDLTLIVQNLLMLGVGDKEAKDEFCRRVQNSQGCEKLKDWMYSTKKNLSRGVLGDVHKKFGLLF